MGEEIITHSQRRPKAAKKRTFGRVKLKNRQKRLILRPKVV